MPKQLALSILAAIAVGVAQTVLLLTVWAYIAAYSPLPAWLLSLGMSGPPWRATIFALDSVINLVLCIPAAYVLCLLRPRRLALYLAAAVVPGFLWQYRLVFEDPSAFSPLAPFLPGILTALLALPLATLVASRVVRRENA
jgi:hypothetical protein